LPFLARARRGAQPGPAPATRLQPELSEVLVVQNVGEARLLYPVQGAGFEGGGDAAFSALDGDRLVQRRRSGACRRSNVTNAAGEAWVSARLLLPSLDAAWHAGKRVELRQS